MWGGRRLMLQHHLRLRNGVGLVGWKGRACVSIESWEERMFEQLLMATLMAKPGSLPAVSETQAGPTQPPDSG